MSTGQLSPLVARLAMTPDTIAWCKSLGDVELRSLASDYLMGARDQSAIDAFNEFEIRFGVYVKGSNTPSKSKKSQKRSRK